MSLVWDMISAPFYVVHRAWLLTKEVCWLIWYCCTGAAQMQRALRKWRTKDEPTHGSAYFAKDTELRKRGYMKPEGFLMCVTRKGRRVYNHLERTVLMFAPPGVGKSLHYQAHLRALVQRPPAGLPFLLIGDATGEHYDGCAALMTAAGYDICRIDLVDPQGWAKYDILSILEPKKPFLYGRQLKALAELMVPDEPGSKQPHFVDFARLLLKCVVTLNVKYEGNNKSIGELVGELISETKRGAMAKRAAVYQDDFITAALETMNKMQDKPEGLSMMSTALRKLESWDDAALKEITCYGPDMHGRYTRGWNFERLYTNPKPVAVFLRTGTQKMGGDFARIFYGNAINTLSQMLDEGRKLHRDLELLMDESGLVGYCNAVTHGYTRLRKARLRIRMTWLDVDEFKNTYPDWKTIYSGSDMLFFGGSNNMEQNRMVSELLGQFTVQSRSESESDNGGSKGKSEQARDLKKKDEVRREEYDLVYVIMDGACALEPKPWRKDKRGNIVFL